MIIDGEKWACEACVRGHRVSNCQHADRPLQHINKKGRPVSQCHHCRAMRKSRTSHVKCDCGEKTHKCAHLQAPIDGHKESCCCNHGGRCTCSHVKEQPSLDPVPESDSENEAPANTQAPLRGAARARKRANTIHADGLLAFDENGHHKPIHRHTKTSHKNGPYQLNRVNSMHSAGSLGNRSVDNLLQNRTLSDLQSSSGSPSSSSGMAQETRRVKSEAASPLLSGTSLGQLTGLPPLDLSGIEYPAYVPNGFDMFSNVSDHEPPVFSAGLSAASVDWSHYDGLDFGASKSTENFAPSSYSQAQSFGFEFNGSEQQPPTLTSNSGEVSEVEDFMAASTDDFEPTFSRQSTNSSVFNLGSLAGTSTGMLGNTDLSTIDYEDFLSMKNKFLPTPVSVSGDEPSLMTASATISTAIGTTPNAMNAFTTLEDETAFWMSSDYSQGLPVMGETSDPNEISFWNAQ